MTKTREFPPHINVLKYRRRRPTSCWRNSAQNGLCCGANQQMAQAYKLNLGQRTSASASALRLSCCCARASKCLRFLWCHLPRGFESIRQNRCWLAGSPGHLESLVRLLVLVYTLNVAFRSERRVLMCQRSNVLAGLAAQSAAVFALGHAKRVLFV